MEKSTSTLGAGIGEGIKDVNDLMRYMEENRADIEVPNPLSYLLEIALENGLSKAELIRNSCVDRSFGYHILDGSKKLTREKALALAIGGKLTVAQTDKFLQYAGLLPLYPRNKRDMVIIFGINKKYSVGAINTVLEELKLPLIDF